MTDSELHEVASHVMASCTPGQIAKLVRLISPGSSCGLMSPDEFERVMAMMAGQSRGRAFSDRSQRAARLILVMGASVSEAAADTGMARQVVHRLMGRIKARLESLPADWVKVEAWLPAEEARHVLDLAKMLRASHDLPVGADIQALDQVALVTDHGQ